MTTDPNRIRCGNCAQRGEDVTWEGHIVVRCDECSEAQCICPVVWDCAKNCGQHADDTVYVAETEADRQAQWAAAHGL